MSIDLGTDIWNMQVEPPTIELDQSDAVTFVGPCSEVGICRVAGGEPGWAYAYALCMCGSGGTRPGLGPGSFQVGRGACVAYALY